MSTGRKLVIVESPAKARTIGGYLGSDYVVESSIGHIRDLPSNAADIPAKIKDKPWGRMAVDVEGDFTPYYVVPRDKKSHMTKLKKLVKDADELYLATDEDREGEAIAWHLAESLDVPQDRVFRVVFNEITQRAIEEAFREPGRLDQDKIDAQQARRVLDRIMGARMVAQARTLAGMYEWQALEHVVDVGGGDGTLLRTLLERFPRPRGTVVDLPGPVSAARATFREAGLVDRADAVEGSFFDPLPGGADAYLLCWVLHDWDDVSARAILRRCAEAAGPTGTVLVAEYGGGAEMSELDVRMLAYFNGRERDGEELAALAAESGLSLAGDHESHGIRLLEFTVGHPM